MKEQTYVDRDFEVIVRGGVDIIRADNLLMNSLGTIH